VRVNDKRHKFKEHGSWCFHKDSHLIRWILWLVHENGISASAKLHKIRCAIKRRGEEDMTDQTKQETEANK